MARDSTRRRSNKEMRDFIIKLVARAKKRLALVIVVKMEIEKRDKMKAINLRFNARHGLLQVE